MSYVVHNVPSILLREILKAVEITSTSTSRLTLFLFYTDHLLKKRLEVSIPFLAYCHVEPFASILAISKK